jgi:diketogulonate reductase-like aldo/keto reductase
MYGRSEKVVGDLTSELGLRKNLFLATKVWTRGKQDGIKQMESSFIKMKVSAMDLMQVHNLVDAQTHMGTLREMKSSKKIRYIGLTHYTESAYPELIRLMKSEKPDFVQFNYNIKVREAEKKLLPTARDLGIAVIINRPFEEGALFASVKGKSLPPWAAEYGINSWAQYFLKFIVSNTAVTCTIPGTSKPQHMKDNIQAGYGEIPDENIRKKMIEFVS